MSASVTPLAARLLFDDVCDFQPDLVLPGRCAEPVLVLHVPDEAIHPDVGRRSGGRASAPAP
jgi:hypothetical protein